jgi:hypothetical protein|uniref:Uncharacterized protein n=1 Tax=Eutreptiella gymnastica TaxID=73025 RepID=A0A6T2B8S4_9EUGL
MSFGTGVSSYSLSAPSFGTTSFSATPGALTVPPSYSATSFSATPGALTIPDLTGYTTSLELPKETQSQYPPRGTLRPKNDKLDRFVKLVVEKIDFSIEQARALAEDTMRMQNELAESITGGDPQLRADLVEANQEIHRLRAQLVTRLGGCNDDDEEEEEEEEEEEFEEAEDAAIPEASDQKFDLEGFKRALEVQYVLEQGPQIEDFIAQAKALTAEDISFIDTHRKVIEAMSSAETRKAYIDGLSEEF